MPKLILLYTPDKDKLTDVEAMLQIYLPKNKHNSHFTKL